MEIFRQYLLIQTTGSIGVVYINRFTVADPDLQIKGTEGVGGGSHPDPEIRGGGGSQNFFFGPSGFSLV